MAIIGNPIISTDFPVDYFSGNGSTTAFTLSIAPASVNAVDVEVSGVSQSPQTYTISGTTLTFSAAPPSGSSNIVIKHRGIAGVPNVPSAASVTSDKLATQTSIPFATSSLGAGNASIMKNRIINGAMVIDQRNAGASVTPSSSYTLDRWAFYNSQASKVTVQQNANSVTPPAGFSNYIGVTSSSSYSITSTDYFELAQQIEGYNTADLAWGTADAKTVTVSFWVRSSLTGTFGAVLGNLSGTRRTYPFTYTINSANTWEYKTATIAGCTDGTWATNNTCGIIIRFGLGIGSTYSTTPNVWATSNYDGVTGATSLVGTNGATWYLTGVQLEVGSSATGYEYRQYGQELALCQRYYYNYANGTYSQIGSGGFYTAGQWECQVYFPVSMRTTPSATIASGTNYYRIITTGSQYYFNSLNATNFSLNVCLLYTSSGISATAGAYGRCDVNGSGAISFSAEL